MIEKTFLALVMAWVANYTGIEAPKELPAIRFVPLCEIQYEINGPRHRCNPEQGAYAFYNTAAKTIVLPDTWSMENIFDRSVLVHEMVHYFQHTSGLFERVSCGGRDIELPAYVAQMAWLHEQGVVNIYGTMKVTPFTLKRLISRC